MAIIEHIASKASVFRYAIQKILTELIPAAAPMEPTDVTRSLGSVALRSISTNAHTEIYIGGLPASQIKEWFGAPW